MKKLNNRGFSLVELLVALVILGLITVPLLHTFLTAAGTTVKSRRMGDATTAAQNVVETLQANSVQKILRYKDAADTNDLADVFSAGSAAAPAVDADGGITLKLTGVRTGDRAFDVGLTLNPTVYKGGGGIQGINDRSITQFTAMDAVYAQEPSGSQNPDAAAEELFSSRNGADADVTSRARKVELVLHADDNASGEHSVTATLNWIYTFHYTVEEEDGTSTSHTDKVESSVPLLTGHVVPSGETLSLYLLFFPYYQGVSDDIYIKNTDNEPCRIFLIKQKSAAATDAAKEPNYGAQVTLEENHPGDTTFFASVFSNIGYSLIDGRQLGSKVIFNQKTGPRTSASRKPFDSGEVVYRTPEDRLYDVTVQVFDSGADMGSDDPLLTFHASTLR